MSTFKIEGFNRGMLTAMVTINGNLSPALYNKQESEIPVNWGNCSEESLNLAKIILISFIKPEYRDSNSQIEVISRKFTQKFINGWGEGSFSVEINIRECFKEHGYEYFYEECKNHEEVH